MADHALTLDTFNLIGPHPSGAVVDTKAAGSDMGNAEAIAEEIDSFLVDAALERISSYGDRTPGFRIAITGLPAAVTAAEVDLLQVVMRANAAKTTRASLVWAPPQGQLPVALDLFTVVMERDYSDGWDFDETPGEISRYFSLSFKGPAFVRSLTATTVSIPAPAGTPPDVTTMSIVGSTANWTTDTELSPAAGAEKISNPGFESNLTGWTINYGTVTRDTSTPIVGSGSAYVAHDSEMQTTFALAVGQAGRQLRIKTTYKAKINFPGAVFPGSERVWGQTRVKWFDSNGVLISDTPTMTTGATAHGVTKTLDLLVTAPANAVTGALVCWVGYLEWTAYVPGGGTGTANSGMGAIPASYGGFLVDSVSTTLVAANIASPGPTLSGGIAGYYTRTALLGNIAEPAEIKHTRASLAQAVGAKKYLGIGYTKTGGGFDSYFVTINGIDAGGAMTTDDTIWVAIPAGVTTISTIAVRRTFYAAAGAVCSFTIASVKISTEPSLVASAGLQALRTLPIDSGVRTPGSIHLSCASGTLGSVIVASRRTPNMASPDLRAKLTSGVSSTADTACVSGYKSALTTLHPFGIAAGGVTPGTHELLARIKPPSGGLTSIPITVTLASKMGGNTIGDTITRSIDAVVDGTTNWQIVSLGDWMLPSVVMAAAGQVAITMQTALSSTQIDDAWHFPIDPDEGEVLRVEAGTATHLWADQPTPAAPLPAVWLGTSADKSNAYGAVNMPSYGEHTLTPPEVTLYVVAGAPAAVEATYFAQWGWNAQ